MTESPDNAWAGKPIVGVVGGIGSGKSTMARWIAEEFAGALFDADEVARALLEDGAIKRQIVEWWGRGVLDHDGRVNRRALATQVFADAGERAKLESLIHPLVAERREAFVAKAQRDPAVRLIVLDVPLLVEVGLHERCDLIVGVRCERSERLRRLAASRGWGDADLATREKNQAPLEQKLDLAHIVVDNTSGEPAGLEPIRDAVSRIL